MASTPNTMAVMVAKKAPTIKSQRRRNTHAVPARTTKNTDQAKPDSLATGMSPPNRTARRSRIYGDPRQKESEYFEGDEARKED